MMNPNSILVIVNTTIQPQKQPQKLVQKGSKVMVKLKRVRMETLKTVRRVRRVRKMKMRNLRSLAALCVVTSVEKVLAKSEEDYEGFGDSVGLYEKSAKHGGDCNIFLLNYRPYLFY